MRNEQYTAQFGIDETMTLYKKWTIIIEGFKYLLLFKSHKQDWVVLVQYLPLHEAELMPLINLLLVGLQLQANDWKHAVIGHVAVD